MILASSFGHHQAAALLPSGEPMRLSKAAPAQNSCRKSRLFRNMSFWFLGLETSWNATIIRCHQILATSRMQGQPNPGWPAVPPSLLHGTMRSVIRRHRFVCFCSASGSKCRSTLNSVEVLSTGPRTGCGPRRKTGHGLPVDRWLIISRPTLALFGGLVRDDHGTCARRCVPLAAAMRGRSL